MKTPAARLGGVYLRPTLLRANWRQAEKNTFNSLKPFSAITVLPCLILSGSSITFRNAVIKLESGSATSSSESAPDLLKAAIECRTEPQGRLFRARLVVFADRGWRARNHSPTTNSIVMSK